MNQNILNRFFRAFAPVQKETNRHFYEDVLANLIDVSLAPPMVAIDCGANVGKHTLRLCRAVSGGGRVYAIEPNPAALETLTQRTAEYAKDGTLTIIQAAASDVPGPIPFFADRVHSALSTVNAQVASERSGADAEQIEVNAITLDDLANDFTRLDFMKVDVEGHEFALFKGAAKTIARFRPAIFFENNRNAGVKRGQYTADELLGFFEQLDYRIYSPFGMRLTHATWLEPGPTNWMAFPAEKMEEWLSKLLFGASAGMFKMLDRTQAVQKTDSKP